MSLSDDTLVESIVQTLSAPAIIVSADGDFVDILSNERTDRLLFDDPAELIGRNLYDVFPEHHASEFQSVIDRTLETGDIQEHEYELQVQSGERYFSGTVAPLPTADQMVMWVAQDVTERETREQELQLFRRLIDEVPECVFIIDPDTGAILDVNQTACDTLGYDRDELLQKHIWDIHADSHTAADFQELLSGRESEDIGPTEIEHVHADGSTIPVEISSAYVEVGDEKYRVGIARDITQRVAERRERERQYAHLLRTESLADTGGFEYHPRTDTLYQTDGIYQIFDLPAEAEPSLDALLDLLVARDRGRLEEAFLACIETGDSFSVDAQAVTNTGRHRWIKVRSERDTGSDETKVVGVIQDITEQKLDEQRLMVLNRVLRHNLRNKLTSILGYVELLEDRFPAETHHLFKQIEESADELLNLAEKTRRFKRVVEYDFTLGRVPLSPVLEDVCNTYRSRYPDATITTDSVDVSIPLHELELELVLAELVENAVKHSNQDRPHVSVSVDRQRDERVSITVADDGPGLPEAEREVLREGRETDLLHSSGMGLWIVNWIVMKRSGDITIASNSPHGTIITVTLPTGVRSGTSPTQQSQQSADDHRR